MTTSRTTGTLWQPIRPYESAERTLAAFDALLDRARDTGVTPSTAVTACRDDLADLALEETQIATEIDGVGEAQSLATADALALLTRDRTETTPEQRIEALTRAIGSHTPQTTRDLRKMNNQNRFRMARLAANRWHALGDDIISGLLAPWADAIITDLDQFVSDVLEHRHAGLVDAHTFAVEHELTEDDIERWDTQLPRYLPHYRRLRAQQLTRQWLQLVESVDGELRARGLTPDLHPESGSTRDALAFEHPEMLPSADYRHTRECLWLCEAVGNGAHPRLTTATLAAQIKRPVEAAA